MTDGSADGYFVRGSGEASLHGGRIGYSTRGWSPVSAPRSSTVATRPSKAYGFAGVVISLEDLSSSVWLWYREGKNGDALRGDRSHRATSY